MTRYWLEFLLLVMYCVGARMYYLFILMMRYMAQVQRWQDVEMTEKQYNIFAVCMALIWPVAASLMLLTPDWREPVPMFKCAGCHKVMPKADAYFFDAHQPGCDWASMIPLTGRTGFRPKEPSDG